MIHITDTNYTFVAAKKILDACYNADKTSCARGSFCVKGDAIDAKIIAQKKVIPFEQGWDVDIKSSVYSAAAIQEIIAIALN